MNSILHIRWLCLTGVLFFSQVKLLYAQSSVPQIGISVNGNAITNGQKTEIDAGSVTENEFAAIVTVTVTNTGGQILSLNAITVPPDFILDTNFQHTIAPGSNATFNVRLNSTTMPAAGTNFAATVPYETQPNPVFWLNSALANNAAGSPVSALNQFTNAFNCPNLSNDSIIGNYLHFNGSQSLVTTNKLNATNALTIIWLSKADTYDPMVDWALFGRNDDSGCSLYSMRNTGHILFAAATQTDEVSSPGVTNWQVNSITFDGSSNLTVRTDCGYLHLGEKSFADNIGSYAPMMIGAIGEYSPYNWVGGMAEIAVWTNVLDPAVLQEQELSMLNRHGLFPRNKIWFLGDSIVYDVHGGGTNYQELVMQALNPVDYLAEADGNPGESLIGMIETNLIGIAQYKYLPIVVISGGVNDLQQLGVGYETLFATASNVCAFYRSQGFATVYVDPTPVKSPIGQFVTPESYNSNRLAFISLCEASWPSWTDGFADIGSDPIYATQAASSNTLWYPDGVHLTPIVYQALAPAITMAVQSIIATGSNENYNFGPNLTTVGVHAGGIVITDNDPANSPFVIPISGTVVAQGASLKVVNLAGTFIFGGVTVGTSEQSTLTISNSGNSDLYVTNISLPPGFSGDWTGTVFPGNSQNVSITFSPTSAKVYSGFVYVNTDAIGGNNVVPVSGYGFRGNLTAAVNVSGNGLVSPDLNGKALKKGIQYTIRAMPAKGSIFSNWTGSIISANNPLTFTMETNTVLEANFVVNPFYTLSGNYNGLFMAVGGVEEKTAGSLRNFIVDDNGFYTGTVLTIGQVHSIAGKFGLNTTATNQIARSSAEGGPLKIVMALNSDGLIGNVIGYDWTSPLNAYSSTNERSADEFTLLINSDSNSFSETLPMGDGYALLTNFNGTVHFSGRLADGTIVNESTLLNSSGIIPIYKNLYEGRGLLIGWINLYGEDSVSSGLNWICPSHARGIYQNGFTNTISTEQIVLSPWRQSLINFELLTNLSFSRGYPAEAANLAVEVSDSGKIKGEGVSGQMNLATGSFKVTVNYQSNTFFGSGVILLNETNGGGYYLTQTNSGYIRLGL